MRIPGSITCCHRETSLEFYCYYRYSVTVCSNTKVSFYAKECNVGKITSDAQMRRGRSKPHNSCRILEPLPAMQCFLQKPDGFLLPLEGEVAGRSPTSSPPPLKMMQENHFQHRCFLCRERLLCSNSLQQLHTQLCLLLFFFPPSG